MTAESRPEWLDDGLFPFRSRFIEAGGAHIHYVDEGSGPTILFLHGNPTWSFLYRHLIRDLRDEFRCVAPDYPGFGLSTAPRDYGFRPEEHSRVVEQLLLELDLREVTLFAQDWGGPIGLGAATKHPERFRALVLGNTWAWPVNGDFHFVFFSKLMGGPIGGFLIRHFNAFVTGIMPRGLARRKLSPEEWKHYEKPFETKASRTPTHVFPREILASREFLADTEEGLRRVRELPMLLLWGDRDIAFRQKELDRWRTSFPHARVVPLPGTGHYIQEDAPEEIARALRSWWAECVATSSGGKRPEE